jgi:hypothetical protein
MKKKILALVAILSIVSIASAGYALFLDTQRSYPVSVRTVGLPSENYGLFTSRHDGSEISAINFSQPISAGFTYEVTYFLRAKGDLGGIEYNMTWQADNLPSYLTLVVYWEDTVWSENSAQLWNTSTAVAISLSLTASISCPSGVSGWNYILTANP